MYMYYMYICICMFTYIYIYISLSIYIYIYIHISLLLVRPSSCRRASPPTSSPSAAGPNHIGYWCVVITNRIIV